MPNHRTLPAGRRSLDHVAMRVVDRDAFTEELLEAFELRVIERTERFTLIGPDFEHGKITLLDAEPGPRPEAQQLVSLVFAEQPDAIDATPRVLSNGVVVTLQSTDDLGDSGGHLPRHSLVGVVLRSEDPERAGANFAAQQGMHVRSEARDVVTVEVGAGAGDGLITLLRAGGEPVMGPDPLDHLGVLVDDAAAWRDALGADGGVIDRWVEAPHSRAVFVPGPDGVIVEFVEQLAPMGV
jgi:catechol 2,3-dioxygenase-like lactoylglutathione lyase family enzyme